jgi:hypothetical protein
MIHDCRPSRRQAGRFDHLVDSGDRPVEADASARSETMFQDKPNLFQTNHLQHEAGSRPSLALTLL